MNKVARMGENRVFYLLQSLLQWLHTLQALICQETCWYNMAFQGFIHLPSRNLITQALFPWESTDSQQWVAIPACNALAKPPAVFVTALLQMKRSNCLLYLEFLFTLLSHFLSHWSSWPDRMTSMAFSSLSHRGSLVTTCWGPWVISFRIYFKSAIRKFTSCFFHGQDT